MTSSSSLALVHAPPFRSTNSIISRRATRYSVESGWLLRLPDEQAAELEAVARVEQISISDAARNAIAESIERAARRSA